MRYGARHRVWTIASIALSLFFLFVGTMLVGAQTGPEAFTPGTIKPRPVQPNSSCTGVPVHDTDVILDVYAPYAVNGRYEPCQDAGVGGDYSPGQQLHMIQYTTDGGDPGNGNRTWYLTDDSLGRLWVWSGNLCSPPCPPPPAPHHR